MREQIARIDGQRRAENQQILGFLRNEIGSAQPRAAATRRRPRATFREAIDIDPRTAPAYLNLGDVHASSRATCRRPSKRGKRLVQTPSPTRLPGVRAPGARLHSRWARRSASSSCASG